MRRRRGEEENSRAGPWPVCWGHGLDEGGRDSQLETGRGMAWKGASYLVPVSDHHPLVQPGIWSAIPDCTRGRWCDPRNDQLALRAPPRHKQQGRLEAEGSAPPRPSQQHTPPFTTTTWQPLPVTALFVTTHLTTSLTTPSLIACCRSASALLLWGCRAWRASTSCRVQQQQQWQLQRWLKHTCGNRPTHVAVLLSPCRHMHSAG
jgi:hypothetical protein